jgi:hypothetical protein
VDEPVLLAVPVGDLQRRFEDAVLRTGDFDAARRGEALGKILLQVVRQPSSRGGFQIYREVLSP